jgi:hypothetical protein
MSRIKTYNEFYQYYLTEHKNKTCRVLHFTGTFLVFILAFLAVYLGNTFLWVYVPILGYGFAWIGHFFFEKNKPATFSYPLWSLFSDFKMFFDILFGKISFDGNKDKL